MPKTIVNGTVYGTDDYADLQNKPQIGGVTLSGNKTLGALGAIPASEKGANNGVATLDGTGKVPSTQIPASVYEAAAAAAQSAEDAEDAKEAILGVFEGSY